MGRAPALIALALVGCDSSTPAPDAAPDADLVDFAFTGTLLDFDSACPIAGATLTATYDDQRTTTTDAAGAFTLSLASYTALVDVMPAPSACGGTYAMPAILIAPPAVSLAHGVIVARLPTQTRVSALALDPTRGNVLIHVNGTPRAFSIGEPHAAPVAFDGTTWSAGDTGTDVFFGNIEIPLSKRATVTVDGGNAIGLGAAQIAPGAITAMTVIIH